MDQARLFIAIALSFLVFLVWEFFFTDRKPVPERTQEQEIEQIEEYEPKRAEAPFQLEERKVNAGIEPISKKEIAKTKTYKTINIDTSLYTAQISEKGGVIKSFALKKYRETVDADSPLLEMVSQDNPFGTVQLSFGNKSSPDLREAVFLSNLTTDTITVNDNTEELILSWMSPQGLVVEKAFYFYPESYLVGFTVKIKNGSEYSMQDNIIVSLMKSFQGQGRLYGFEGPSALINNELEQIKLDKIEDKNVYRGKLQWITVQDRYFMTGIIPETPEKSYMRLFLFEDNLLENQLVEPVSIINPGTQQVFKYKLYFGPKRISVLKEIGHNLDKTVNFGMFNSIAKPCVWLLNFLYGLVPNYGIVIIILTMLIKIVLWPLGTKSYKSMAEMKKIQPLMAEIREKYKNDKKKMNEEVMGLYKTYKINPLGGCLPMLVQLPIFFALYRMLYETIELRHAPFFGWINDLSAPDRLFHFNFSIPFMQAPYGFPVLTIIMGATMFLQQKMQPPMGDPAQAKMMMLMPIVFTVIFINFSSGLVLYWLVNNVISIAQQYYTTKKKV